MPSPSSSVPRATPILSVPASQNTAPVIKFRCLYTHDVRRKAKRWQDGYLRYHTFNKRIMAYDTTGNFIGDLHWRKDEAIQDGDELELDQGVLIQVGEPMEKTETDVSSLYSHKKSQRSPSRPGEPPTPSVRSLTPLRSTASQPARSLNDLLGIKKNPTGRLVSPYEERYPPEQSRDHLKPPERSAKRQRLAQENVLPGHGLSRPHTVTTDLSEEPPAAKPTTVAVATESVVKPKKASSSVKVSSSTSVSTPDIEPRGRIELPGVEKTKNLTKKTKAPVRESVQDVNQTMPDPVSTNADFMPSASTMVALEVSNDSIHGPDRTTQVSVPTVAGHRSPGTLTKSASTGLRKSYSDPTALTTINGIRPRSLPFKSPLNHQMDEDPPREQGPWTSEALDLFDFWPPGRPKPN
ncbi:hypothetical protein BBP40_008031 [Aspergillus hancockii]|nr:hypothetical protein BBP40_008031 [Aspergillus hancockii]